MEQQQIKDTVCGLNQMLANRFNGLQPQLVSGENIKTVNNQSILGSGNLAIQDKPTTYSNISVSVTPTKMSSYCAWDTMQKYGYKAVVTIDGLTSTSLIQNLVMTDTLLANIAYITTTEQDALIFYTPDNSVVNGTILQLTVMELDGG